ncbi:hypothetical protein YB2330_003858 [Saitoella coloradoensis]
MAQYGARMRSQSVAGDAGDEYEKFNQLVIEDPDDFDAWEGLIRSVESTEGGIGRNSSPDAIHAWRTTYDRFLARFPLLFGYWRKYAETSFTIAGTEAAEMVYERGVASCPASVDLWASYCGFKADTSHLQEDVRELFERAANTVGLDFLAHPFWDKYIEFEERNERPDLIFKILDRVIHIPMHQYARYFQRYTAMAATRPLHELVNADVIETFRNDVLNEPVQAVQAGSQQIKMQRGEAEIEREIRLRIADLHKEICHKTQTETAKRWTYEAEVKRPYFHVKPLDEPQLVNWRKYLHFEETEGDFQRIVFLYERCLTTCALYDEFWYRYARWMAAQPGKEEDVRIIYQRGSATFVPIGRPGFRIQFAHWMESQGEVEYARAIFEAVVESLPGNVETVVAWANMERRATPGDVEGAVKVYRDAIDNDLTDLYAKGALSAEWARLLWKVTGSTEEARELFSANADKYLDSKYFWINYLQFEIDQPASEEQHTRITTVIGQIRTKTHLPLPVIKDLTHTYMVYLLEAAPSANMAEYTRLDIEVNGPFSVQLENKKRLREDGDLEMVERRLIAENGHPGVEVDESRVARGESVYERYYREQGEKVPPTEQSGAAPRAS